MKRIFVLGAVLLLLSTFSLWMGCSDDDEATSPTLAQGDTLDPGFISFREGYDATNMTTDMMLEMIFHVTDSLLHDADNPNAKPLRIPTSLQIEDNSITVTYHSASQYWYVDFLGTYGEQDSMIVIDSVQFLHATGPVQWPDSASLTGIKSGMSFHLREGLWVGDATQSVTLLGDFPNLGEVVANGFQHVSIAIGDDVVHFPDDDMDCEFSLAFTTTFTNVTLDLEHMGDGCPLAGSLTSIGTAAIDCSNETDTVTVGGSWKVTESFTGTVANWVIENATTRWVGVDSCGADIKRINPILPIVKKAR